MADILLPLSQQSEGNKMSSDSEHAETAWRLPVSVLLIKRNKLLCYALPGCPLVPAPTSRLILHESALGPGTLPGGTSVSVKAS